MTIYNECIIIQCRGEKMRKMSIQELEEVILDQVEKLNQDDVNEDAEKAKQMIERSNSIAELTHAFVDVQRIKLDVVKELNRGGTLYEKYLGIESDKPTGRV